MTTSMAIFSQFLPEEFSHEAISIHFPDGANELVSDDAIYYVCRTSYMA